MRYRHLPWAAILISVAFVAPTAEGREKIDEIVMDNGDRIICEIKELEQGILKVKPPYTKGYVPRCCKKVETLDSPTCPLTPWSRNKISSRIEQSSIEHRAHTPPPSRFMGRAGGN